MKYSKDLIEKAVKAKGYKWFTGGGKDYDVNIVGVRNSDTGNAITNKFDDTLTISFKIGDEWIYKEWSATTDAGMKSMMNFSNSNGCARLVPNQYRGSHAIGLHKGKYEALRQVGKVQVFRDKNKDEFYDETFIDEGYFGINIHRSNPKVSYVVDGWSAGCQVFQKGEEFEDFMAICRTAAEIWGNRFSYTLIESKDIDK